MPVRKIDTDSLTEKQRFIDLPFELYATSPLWVPPIRSNVAFVLNRFKHPFYQHSQGEFFIVEEKGKVLGRLAVLDKQPYNTFHKKYTAFFYLFEAVEDTRVASLLFDQAKQWARQRGLTEIIGPFGFLQGDSIGILVDGFEHRPALGQSYNYPYYDKLLKEVGFRKRCDYLSGYLPGDYQLSDRFYTIAERVKEKRGFWIKSFKSKKELKQWIGDIQRVYNEAFVGNLSYSPLNEIETKVVAQQMLAIANPQLIKLVMKQDQIIGFLFAFADITDGIRSCLGRIWPWGWLVLLRESRRTSWVNFNGTGILPGHRGVGANAVLYTEMAKTIRQFQFKHADIVQISEENIKSMGDMKAIGVKWYKTHRIYEISL